MLRVLALLVILAATDEVRLDLPVRVVVHRTNTIATLSRADVSAIFMRRVGRWRPVDQVATSHVRERFSASIHGKSVAFVVRYWQRLIFAGRAIPPPEVRGDAAVLEFIRRNPDAIGYVDPATPLGDDVKVLPVTR